MAAVSRTFLKTHIIMHLLNCSVFSHHYTAPLCNYRSPLDT
ncbi:hypothetical protein T11_6826 [Trichinella zimbabwensis]|uniref:Uncharacterized protein n=1 Tax=Trichinella zimbabwensis TaxID=268475 RepID=A0A0V1GJG5_9BILA|nr:hypothetical protein T11_6826 [Trichinella zimbabwensis]